MANTTLDFQFTTVPPTEVVAAKYDEVGDNARNLDPAFDDVLDMLEKVHATHFARLNGRYVRTGATKASLTGAGAGAIREADDNSLSFGTSIFYAHFLTKAPKDPEFGQVWKGRKDLRFAVLVMPPGTEKKVGEMLLGYIVEPFE
jgi:hypothetical protein